MDPQRPVRRHQVLRRQPAGVTCSHPNNDAIIRLAAELKAVIYIHTWMNVGGQPRRPGGGNERGESTPMDVALLAERFPEVPLICGHSGGDWELGVRAVRQRPNVYIEFSGSDPHSGQVDYTVAELGADRLVWGGHGPSRSYSTELSKVLDADLNDAQRRQIFGGNLRRIAASDLPPEGLSAGSVSNRGVAERAAEVPGLRPRCIGVVGPKRAQDWLLGVERGEEERPASGRPREDARRARRRGGSSRGTPIGHRSG